MQVRQSQTLYSTYTTYMMQLAEKDISKVDMREPIFLLCSP